MQKNLATTREMSGRCADAAALAQAWALASTHGAAPLAAEIQALARRARIELSPAGPPSAHDAAGQDASRSAARTTSLASPRASGTCWR